MRILIATVGSHGDILPFITLGKEFQRRGHDVRFYADKTFENLASKAALRFTPMASGDEYRDAMRNPDITDPIKGMRMVGEAVGEYAPMFYRAMSNDIDPGNTIMVGSTFAFAARLLREKHHVPTAIVQLSPSLFRSEYMAPRLSPLGHMQRVPRIVKRFMWSSMDRMFLDSIFAAPFNRVRHELGLPPIVRAMHDWVHQADLLIGLFPEWFAERQPDWPAELQLTGFPFETQDDTAPVSDELNDFLQAGDAPVGFTAGTANATSHRFFATSAEACRLSGRRGLLITQDAAQLPPSLPPGVLHVPFAPFRTLLPKLAAIVHHGGIGSTSEALRAGVPQLIRPMAFDQFDNASRAVRLGAAREILPRLYKPEAVTQALAELIDNASVRANCAKLARQLAAEDGIARACDTILQLQPC